MTRTTLLLGVAGGIAGLALISGLAKSRARRLGLRGPSLDVAKWDELHGDKATLVRGLRYLAAIDTKAAFLNFDDEVIEGAPAKARDLGFELIFASKLRPASAPRDVPDAQVWIEARYVGPDKDFDRPSRVLAAWAESKG